MSARLWMDRFLLHHTFSLVDALASAFSHGATLGSREMMTPKYRVLCFTPTRIQLIVLFRTFHHVTTQTMYDVNQFTFQNSFQYSRYVGLIGCLQNCIYDYSIRFPSKLTSLK